MRSSTLTIGPPERGRGYAWLVGQLADAQNEAHAVVRRVARERGTITYGELVGHIHALDLDPNSDTLARILDDISIEEHRSGRGMLSAVVIRADTNLPGEGFFKLARKLEHDPADEVAFHAEELRRVHDAFDDGLRRG
jgi:hypothetical protein